MARMRSRWSAASSGRPKTQSLAVRCAVLASIRQVLGLRDQRDRLARGRVGQAQERDVGRVQQARALGRVLARSGGDAQHLDVAAPREILVDAQAGGAFLAVDKDSGRHAGFSEGIDSIKQSRPACLPRDWADNQLHGDEETQGPRPRPRSAARPPVRSTSPRRPKPTARRTRLRARRSCSPARYQPRTRMDEGSLYELAESIKAQGVMQPILVRPLRQASSDGASATRSSPASAASAPPGWPGSTTCRCWCATCPTRPPRRWR